MSLAAGVAKIVEKMRAYIKDYEANDEIVLTFADALDAMEATHAPSVEVEPLGPTTAERLDRAEKKLREFGDRINALEKVAGDAKRWCEKADQDMDATDKDLQHVGRRLRMLEGRLDNWVSALPNPGGWPRNDDGPPTTHEAKIKASRPPPVLSIDQVKAMAGEIKGGEG